MDNVALHRGTVQVRSPDPPPGSLAPACSCRHTFIGSATTEVKGSGTLSLSSGGMTEVKGSLVKLG